MDSKEKELLQCAYTYMEEHCGIKVGDKVKVSRRAVPRECGWTNDWNDTPVMGNMNDCVGKTKTVTRVGRISRDGFSSLGIELDGHFQFPFFVLEKITDE